MMKQLDSIRTVLDAYPRAGIVVGPTPILELPRLSSHLGHHVYVLRDDLTGFALGGNKVRKLDYLIGDAIAKKADVLVTSGASSFSRNAAAAGKVFGFGVHVFVAGEESGHNSASRALFEQFGATLHYVSSSLNEELAARQESLASHLSSQGKVVYELHPGGSNEIGALGYAHAFDQIVRHTRSTGIHFHKIMLATGSTGTQVGLLLGQCISGYDSRVIGLAVSQPADIQRRRVRKLALSTAEMLGIEFDESTLLVDDRFIGGGYTVPSEEGERAVRAFAVQEGLLLDQVYSGKAAAGLIHYAMNGMFDPDDNILFIHTGGNAGLFY
jgi:1-aminocyclopropane-1-carboxylate deaminase/D-cysteine desulfhydrase-like pyridoxal-dependent ACC family enzyme